MKNHSLFSFGPSINPLYFIDRWLNPYSINKQVNLKEKKLNIQWTTRAQKEFSTLPKPLIVEMQLYFSCVVKKRVLFTEAADFNTEQVHDSLQVAFHPVEAASCDPIEFAKNFPAKREFDSISAKKMHPSQLNIDFKRNTWMGEFYI